MRLLPTLILVASITGCATTRAVRATDVANNELLPTNVNFLSTPGAVTWDFPTPVHVVVLEEMTRGSAFRVAYSATPEDIGPDGNFGPIQLMAATTTRARATRPSRDSIPVMPSFENGSQCLRMSTGAGSPAVALNCSPNYLTGAHKPAAHRRVFLRSLMLVVSAAPIDTAALVVSDRWVRKGVRPPGTTGDWAVMPLASTY